MVIKGYSISSKLWCWSLTITLFNVISRTLICCGGQSYCPAKMQLVDSTASANGAWNPSTVNYVEILQNCIHCTFIFTFFVLWFLKSYFFKIFTVLSNTKPMKIDISLKNKPSHCYGNTSHYLVENITQLWNQVADTLQKASFSASKLEFGPKININTANAKTSEILFLYRFSFRSFCIVILLDTAIWMHYLDAN